jgi:zinc protease
MRRDRTPRAAPVPAQARTAPVRTAQARTAQARPADRRPQALAAARAPRAQRDRTQRERARRALALAAAALAAALVALSAHAQPASWPDPSTMTFAPIHFQAPTPRKAVLANGITVYLAEDHSLPLVQGVAYVDAPSVYDPAGKVGLAGFTAHLLRDGGAGGRSPDAIDEQLATLGATVEASSNDVLASVSFSALASNVDQVLPIWQDVLTRPDFDPSRIDIERQRQLDAIKRVVDNPVQLAVREFSYRVAEGHPSGAYPTAATINAIQRSDLIAFHNDYYGPASTVIAITGDFNADAMLNTLNATLGAWQHALPPKPTLPPFNEHPTPKVYFTQKDVQQSIILIGEPAMRAYTPSYDTFMVANQILGAGGFTSRLFTDIRTKRGLAYTTGSQLSQGFAFPGIFLAYAFTRSDATGQVLQLMLSEIKQLRDQGVSAAEVTQARNQIVNQAVFRDTSVADTTERTARVQLLGLPPGYFQTYLDTVQTITPAEVQSAARQVLNPDGLVIMVVGNAAAFDEPLSDFGQVVNVPLQ